MSEYKEVTQTVEIPQHSGMEGFIAVIRQILRLPKVTRVEFDSIGKVTYTRYARAEEPRKNIDFDFDTVTPAALVRNIDLQELDLFYMLGNAAVCMSRMFYAAEVDHMVPVALLTGANTVFYDWHLATTGVPVGHDSAYGLPLYRDRFIPDETLLLVVAYSRDASLVDARKSYKIGLPSKGQIKVSAQEVIIETRVPQVSSSEVFILAAPPTDSDVKVTQ